MTIPNEMTTHSVLKDLSSRHRSSEVIIGRLCESCPALAYEIQVRIHTWDEDTAPADYYGLEYNRMQEIAATISKKLSSWEPPRFDRGQMCHVTQLSRNTEEVATANRLFIYLKAKAHTEALRGQYSAWLNSNDTERLGIDGTRHLSETMRALGFNVKLTKGSMSNKPEFYIHWGPSTT